MIFSSMSSIPEENYNRAFGNKITFTNQDDGSVKMEYCSDGTVENLLDELTFLKSIAELHSNNNIQPINISKIGIVLDINYLEE